MSLYTEREKQERKGECFMTSKGAKREANPTPAGLAGGFHWGLPCDGEDGCLAKHSHRLPLGHLLPAGSQKMSCCCALAVPSVPPAPWLLHCFCITTFPAPTPFAAVLGPMFCSLAPLPALQNREAVLGLGSLLFY